MKRAPEHPAAIVLSAGYGQFHLATAATLLDRRGSLASYIVSGYPPPGSRRILAARRLPGGFHRLAQRSVPIPRHKVRTVWIPELAYQVAQQMNRVTLLQSAAQPRVAAGGLRSYGRRVARLLPRLNLSAGAIYHYRAGFGGESVHVARMLGLRTVCDHSIVHPLLVDGLVHDPLMPWQPSARAELNPFWHVILRDIEAADAVIVNSSFVADTFRAAGHQGPVATVPLGLDPDFRVHLQRARRRPEQAEPAVSFLFAGTVEARKGIGVLAQALEETSARFRLTIVGDWDPGMLPLRRRLAHDPRVVLQGKLPRAELAAAMRAADVFVFPSLAEGSARVVLEAMAAGCAIITTRSAGSRMRDGEHGVLVGSGDSRSLSQAMARLAGQPETVSAMGRRAEGWTLAECTPDRYVDQLQDVYASLEKLRT